MAKFLMPGKDPGGFIITALIGMAGSLIGAFISRTFWGSTTGQTAGWIMSILGAIILLALYRMIIGRRASI
ncbi:MAG: GlsB/YeaQ/YmgE family stress response membrane protein [Acidobacteria bacterium]|nr:GlsB/YeaQ/YmgE family stress response membrane protein [Acidobacteriota bacterium]